MMPRAPSLSTAINVGTLTAEHHLLTDLHPGYLFLTEEVIEIEPFNSGWELLWRRMDCPPLKKLQGSSSELLGEEPMEVDPPLPGQDNCCNIKLARKHHHICWWCTRGSLFPSLHWNDSICQRALVLVAAPCHPSFHRPHTSPRLLTSSFPSSVENGRTGTGVLWTAMLEQQGESSRWSWAPCDLQVSPEEECRTETGILCAAALRWQESMGDQLRAASRESPEEGRWQVWDWCPLRAVHRAAELPAASKLC